jgi:hypothetical protein
LPAAQSIAVEPYSGANLAETLATLGIQLGFFSKISAARQSGILPKNRRPRTVDFRTDGRDRKMEKLPS